MKIGFALPVFELSTGRTRGLSDLARDAARAEELGFDSLWVMDHLWIEREGRRTGGHEPMVALAHLAARTSRIQLGSLVLCNAFRQPVQLAREAAALADASGGRFILGLGAGWHGPEYRAMGLPFDRRVSRLEETLRVLGPLLAGERVSFQGAFVHLEDASVLGTAPAPPIWVAAGGERMLRLTSEHAGGWNTAWHGPDPSAFAAQAGRLREMVAEAGRPAGAVELSVGVFALPVTRARSEAILGRAAERVSSGGGRDPRAVLERTAVVGPPARIAASLRDYAGAGADHAILSLSVSPFGLLDESLLEAAGEILQEARARR